MRTIIGLIILTALCMGLAGLKVYKLTESLDSTQKALVEANTLLEEERANLVALRASKQSLEDSLSLRIAENKKLIQQKEKTDAQLSNALSKPEVRDWANVTLPSVIDDIMLNRTNKN